MNKELAALEDLITDRARREAQASVKSTFSTFAERISSLTGAENLSDVSTKDGRSFAAAINILEESALELTTRDLAYKIAADLLRRQDALFTAQVPGVDVIIEEDIPDDCD